MNKKIIEISVGLFMLLSLAALAILSIKVSGLSHYNHKNTYPIIAAFDNIGGLKVRAPVRVAGVRVGEVGNIQLDTHTYRARVTLLLDEKSQKTLPSDTAASILTEGLLGANYISLKPGFENVFLKSGDTIEETHSAIILENMISHLFFNLGKGNNSKSISSPLKTKLINKNDIQ